MTAQVYIALGTNVGDRLNYLHRALLLLDNHPNMNVKKVSSIYETDPVGYTNQGEFLNMVAEVAADLTSHELLAQTAIIENQIGRKRTIRWGPRTIDLDILLYNQENINTETLQIPHPRMDVRAFVLIPLAEVNADVHIPGNAQPLPALIRKTPDKEGVRLWKQNRGEGKFGLFES